MRASFHSHPTTFLKHQSGIENNSEITLFLIFPFDMSLSVSQLFLLSLKIPCFVSITPRSSCYSYYQLLILHACLGIVVAVNSRKVDAINNSPF